MGLGGERQPSLTGRALPARGEIRCALGGPGGGLWSTAPGRGLRRVVERGGDRRIGPSRRPCQVPGALLRLDDDRSQSRVDGLSTVDRRPRVGCGREQRMCEPDVVAIADQHARAFGLGQPATGHRRPGRRLQQAHGRLRGGRCVERDGVGVGLEIIEPPAHERVEVQPLGERVEVGGRLAVRDGPTELERVEGVPARHGVQPHETRPREFEPDTRPQHPVDLVDRQPAEVDPADALRSEPVERRDGHLGVTGPLPGEDTDGNVVQPAKHEVEDARRWLVEPGHVVDRDHERLAGGCLAHDVPDRDRHGQWLWRGSGGDAKQGRLEGDPLGLGELGELLVRDLPEQIGERCEGQPGLDLGRPRDQDPVSTFPGAVDGMCPQRGLADAGRAREQQRAEPTRDGIEEPRGLREFAVTPDDGRCHGPKQCMAATGRRSAGDGEFAGEA